MRERERERERERGRERRRENEREEERMRERDEEKGRERERERGKRNRRNKIRNRLNAQSRETNLQPTSHIISKRAGLSLFSCFFVFGSLDKSMLHMNEHSLPYMMSHSLQFRVHSPRHHLLLLFFRDLLHCVFLFYLVLGGPASRARSDHIFGI